MKDWEYRVISFSFPSRSHIGNFACVIIKIHLGTILKWVCLVEQTLKITWFSAEQLFFDIRNFWWSQSCKFILFCVHVLVLPFRAIKEGGENTTGAGKSQTKTGCWDNGPTGPDSWAPGSNRGAQGPTGQKRRGATGCSEQVCDRHYNQ